MDSFDLFFATGHPVFYLLYRAERMAQAQREEGESA